MTNQKSKGQELAEYFNKKLREKGLPEVPIVKPEKGKIWVQIKPRKSRKSGIKSQSKGFEGDDSDS